MSDQTPRPDDLMIATVQGDIATADTAERVTRCAIDPFGRIVTLINNAGVFVARRFTREFMHVNGGQSAGHQSRSRP